MLTQKQINWSKNHDWFLKDNKDGSIMVNDFSVDMVTLESFQTVKKFDNIESLKDWAGY
jgi:hypothetical protein